MMSSLINLDSINLVQTKTTYLYDSSAFNAVVSMLEDIMAKILEDSDRPIKINEMADILRPYLDELWLYISDNDQNSVCFIENDEFYHFSLNKEHFIDFMLTYLLLSYLCND